MTEAGINLSFTADTSGTKSAADEVVGDIQRIGETAEAANRKIRAASVTAQEIYKDDIRVLSLRASGLNGVADALEKQNNQRRQALELSKKTQLSEAEALKLVRQRAAQEERAKAAASARAPLPAMNRVQLSNAGGKVNGRPGASTSGGKSGDLNAAYYVAQDLVQGGPAAVANQLPIIVDLVKRYPMLAMGAIAAGSTFLAASAFKYMRSQTDESDSSGIGQRRISSSIANAAKMVRQRREKAAEAGTADGEATSEMHSRVTRELASQAQYRQGVAGISSAANEARYRSRRAAAGDIEDPIERIKKTAELDKEYAAAKTAAARRNLDDELRVAETEETMARRRKEDLDQILLKEKQRIAIGGQASGEEIRAVAAARAEAQALDARLKAATERVAALKASSGLFNLQSQTLRPLEDQGIDADANRAIEEVRRNIASQGLEAFKSLRKIFGDFYNGIADDMKRRNESTGKFRRETEEDMEVEDLRSRGRRHAADKLQKRIDIGRDARGLEESGGYTPEEAEKLAEKRYRQRHPNGRIQGAGYGGGGKGAAGSPLDNYLVPGRHMEKPGERSGEWNGLDGLDRLQRNNHKVRGAGFKGDKPGKDQVGSEAGQPEGGGQGGGVIGVLFGILNSMNRKLDGLQPGRQPTRR